MWLSILIPTKFPEKFVKFYESLVTNCKDKEGIELVILEDGPEKTAKIIDGLAYFDEQRLTYPSGATRSEQIEYCLHNARGSFVWFANDDITCETPNWDVRFRELVNKFDDKIVLGWPNDLFFRARLSIFPLLTRNIAKQLFPMPYQRYKIDDTIFDVFPPSRRIFMEDVIMRHGDGKTYSCEPESYKHDDEHFGKRMPHRHAVRTYLRGQIKSDKELKVFLGVPRALRPQSNEFYDHYNILDKPDGTIATFCSGQSPAKNRNIMIEQAQQNKCTHIMLLDDDTAYNTDLIYRLLAHDVEIVTGLYLKRDYPHEPIIFDFQDERGWGTFKRLKRTDKGLIEVVSAGFGCCLIKMSVFDRLDKFYGDKAKPYVRLGEIEQDNWCDDTGFFRRCSQAGIKIHCDLDALVGHQGQVTIWPNREGDQWNVIYRTLSNGAVQFKMPFSDQD